VPTTYAITTSVLDTLAMLYIAQAALRKTAAGEHVFRQLEAGTLRLGQQRAQADARAEIAAVIRTLNRWLAGLLAAWIVLALTRHWLPAVLVPALARALALAAGTCLLLLGPLEWTFAHRRMVGALLGLTALAAAGVLGLLFVLPPDSGGEAFVRQGLLAPLGWQVGTTGGVAAAALAVVFGMMALMYTLTWAVLGPVGLTVWAALAGSRRVAITLLRTERVPTTIAVLILFRAALMLLKPWVH